jgi:hypothetical protein
VLTTPSLLTSTKSGTNVNIPCYQRDHDQHDEQLHAGELHLRQRVADHRAEDDVACDGEHRDEDAVEEVLLDVQPANPTPDSSGHPSDVP